MTATPKLTSAASIVGHPNTRAGQRLSHLLHGGTNAERAVPVYSSKTVTIEMAHEVVLYSGPGCGLCEAARRALEQLSTHHAFRLREIDIHSDPVLERRWLIAIPVIEVDGKVVTQAPVDLDAVVNALHCVP